jgi:lipoic acid synthetase
LDPEEPERTARAVSAWGVSYVVLTSVDRDELVDSGAQHFARTVQLIKARKPELLVECLTGDFKVSELWMAPVTRGGDS